MTTMSNHCQFRLLSTVLVQFLANPGNEQQPHLDQPEAAVHGVFDMKNHPGVCLSIGQSLDLTAKFNTVDKDNVVSCVLRKTLMFQEQQEIILNIIDIIP